MSANIINNVALLVNGSHHAGWKEVSITRSIETLSGAFNLTVTEHWPQDNDGRPIAKGDACRVLIDGQLVITGYVNDVNPSYDAQSHDISISGRDKSGDLVDCSIMNTSQLKGQKLETILNTLTKPFGIPVSVDVDTEEAFKNFGVQQGEQVFDAIERACKARAVLCLADGKGGILITRAGRKRAADRLELGKNILSGSLTDSDRDRFSIVTVKGQTQGSDNTSATTTTRGKATATDSEIKRYRPLLVTPDSQADTKRCGDRAAWEVANRKGKGKRADITVQGWKQSNGLLWEINSLVHIKDPLLKLDEVMLIASTTFKQDNQSGTITELSLVPPDAYKLIREGDEPHRRGRRHNTDPDGEPTTVK